MNRLPLFCGIQELHVGTSDGTQYGTGHGDDDVEHGVPNGLVHVSERFKG